MSLLPIHYGFAVSATVISCCAAVWFAHMLKLAGWPRGIRAPWLLAFFFCLAMGCLFIPIQGVPVLYSLRGALGEFSVTTLIWAMAAFIGQLRDKAVIDAGQRFVILCGFALAAVVLYPAALGLGSVDPYAWGYFSTPFLIGLGALSLIALMLGLHWAVFLLCGGLTAAALGVLPSANAWDYLIDPVFAVYAILAVGLATVRRLRKPPVLDSEDLNTLK